MAIKKYKNPVCVVTWQDAAYSFSKQLPREMPVPQVTAGFVISANEKFVNIATNAKYDKKNGKLWPSDGFLIPKKSIIKFKKYGNLNA